MNHRSNTFLFFALLLTISFVSSVSIKNTNTFLSANTRKHSPSEKKERKAIQNLESYVEIISQLGNELFDSFTNSTQSEMSLNDFLKLIEIVNNENGNFINYDDVITIYGLYDQNRNEVFEKKEFIINNEKE